MVAHSHIDDVALAGLRARMEQLARGVETLIALQLATEELKTNAFVPNSYQSNLVLTSISGRGLTLLSSVNQD